MSFQDSTYIPIYGTLPVMPILRILRLCQTNALMVDMYIDCLSNLHRTHATSERKLRSVSIIVSLSVDSVLHHYFSFIGIESFLSCNHPNYLKYLKGRVPASSLSLPLLFSLFFPVVFSFFQHFHWLFFSSPRAFFFMFGFLFNSVFFYITLFGNALSEKYNVKI